MLFTTWSLTNEEGSKDQAVQYLEPVDTPVIAFCLIERLAAVLNNRDKVRRATVHVILNRFMYIGSCILQLLML